MAGRGGMCARAFGGHEQLAGFRLDGRYAGNNHHGKGEHLSCR